MTPTPRMINVNVGVLGHVDSGKTQLVRVLSTHLSTAALDKHPQAQQRGMTLDLGFSALRLPSGTITTSGDAEGEGEDTTLQLTLVDCPGHASLLKTILGGVHIIDWVLLVVDVTKGLQPQTIECLVVSHWAVHTSQIIIALNKIDLVAPTQREERIHSVTKEIHAFLHQQDALSRRSYGPSNLHTGPMEMPPMVAVAAAAAATSAGANDKSSTIGMDELVSVLQQRIRAQLPHRRHGTGPMALAIDHCFARQGNGTILTGTMLYGSVRVGDEIELPSLGETHRVRSLQVFKKTVHSAQQGDRVAMRVNGLDAARVERGLVVTPRSVPMVDHVVIAVQQVPLFPTDCKSGSKYHTTIGHATVMAVATFFERHERPVDSPRHPAHEQRQNQGDCIGHSSSARTNAFAPTQMYYAVSVLASIANETDDQEAHGGAGLQRRTRTPRYALLQFEKPVLVPSRSIVVCSRLDLNPKEVPCRLAFHGDVLAIGPHGLEMEDDRVMLPLEQLRIGRLKDRTGVVDKVLAPPGNEVQVLGRELFAKDADWSAYTNTIVFFTESGQLGRVVGPFGKSGKCRIQMMAVGSGEEPSRVPRVGERVVLRFIKLTKLRARKGTATVASNKVGANGGASRRLLQDEDLEVLYPEAFRPRSNTVTQEMQELSAPPIGAAQPSQTPQQPNQPPGPGMVPLKTLACGHIERLKGETTEDGRNPFAIVAGLFDSEATALAAVGSSVQCHVGHTGHIERGKIEKPFGKAGKVRVCFALHGEKNSGGTLARKGDPVGLIADQV